MKKVTILSLTVVVIAVATMAVFYSCGKQDVGNPSKVENQVISEQDLKINNLIRSFRAKMDYFRDNPEYKSGEVMEVDSAVWFIDATINYYYAKANHSFCVMHFDTIYLEMNAMDSNKAMLEQVFATYDASLFGLSEKYYAIEGENKQFIMAIVEDMGLLSDNRHNLRIVTLIGTCTPTQSDDFGVDDAYLFYMGANINCDGEPTQGGAPEIFEEMLSNHYNPEAGNNCRWYFYGAIVTKTLFYNDYQMNDPLTNYLDYKIFAASQSVAQITSETECLEWNQNSSGIHEMQFYYDNLIELIDEWLESGQNTNNLKFASSTITSADRPENGYRVIKHIPSITFRKRGVVCDEIELPPVY